ncbi:histidine kinase [Streptomyces xiamenensis]|uniref:sensor histidine kinase n=1 Tax=Streptomyces xiamenensis TaxID=408015 RepID=UPI003412E0F6
MASVARRLTVRDVALSVAVGCVTTADLAADVPGSGESDWFSWLMLALSVAGLLAHRVLPLFSAVVTGAGSLAWTLYGHIGELLNLPFMVSLYFVAVSGHRGRTVRVAVAAALLSGAAAVLAGREAGNAVPSPVLELAVPLVPLLLGEAVRGRRELTAHYAERARHAEREREREADRRVREERVRIARELHDIVAHSVSAMTVQAAVALDALDHRPEVARGALRQVRASGREAVRELSATVAVLREDGPGGGPGADGGPPPTAPTPRLSQLEELIARMSGDRLRVTLRDGSGAGAALPTVVELAAYRIVQEALTNVVKHSAARTAGVWIHRSGEGGAGPLTVEVVDEGPPAAGGSRVGEAVGGFGLLGMRERAATVGGTIACGPTPDGGFRVRAVLPVHPCGTPATTVATNTGET